MSMMIEKEIKQAWKNYAAELAIEIERLKNRGDETSLSIAIKKIEMKTEIEKLFF